MVDVISPTLKQNVGNIRIFKINMLFSVQYELRACLYDPGIPLYVPRLPETCFTAGLYDLGCTGMSRITGCIYFIQKCVKK